ncbi:MAG TPA: cytochrome c3 family protein [Coriobacteriia bacterium]|nr:cytochrome c3 family protein [Coriobacteriia bacterium]
MSESTYEEHAEEAEATDQEPGDLGDRSRGPIALAIILLVLLLTVCAIVGSLTRFQLSRAQFLARNAECLVCHTEVLEQMKLTSQHQPFVTEHCTSCHTPHGSSLQVKQRTWFASFSEGMGLWLRWGPFRWLVDRFQPKATPAMHTNGVASTTETTRRGLGPSELVAEEATLCWSCHPGIAPDRDSSVPHMPFENDHCTSCHNPHASSKAPLLLGRNDRELCGRCHPMPDLNRQHLHQPAVQWQCRSCHRAHGSNYSGMLLNRQRIVCFACHPDVAQDDLLSVIHEPFGGDECTGCHEPHGADVDVLLIAAQPELCYGCHPRTRPEFDRVSHHPVPTKIICTDCHRPHGARYQGLLVDEEKQMCLGCHSAIDHLRVQVFQHEPFEQQKCTACHVPHGSDDAPLLEQSEPGLCYSCHPKVANEFAMKSHHPVGKKLKCSGCHEVHASPYWALLHTTGNKLCLGCHSKVEAVYHSSLHRGLDCVRCHKWHGSDYWPLLQKKNPPLCLDCHQPKHYYSGPRAHPTWPKFWDSHAGRPLTCTSTCHNAHGTSFEHMVRRYDPDWDGQCRQCHADVGVLY